MMALRHPLCVALAASLLLFGVGCGAEADPRADTRGGDAPTDVAVDATGSDAPEIDAIDTGGDVAAPDAVDTDTADVIDAADVTEPPVDARDATGSDAAGDTGGGEDVGPIAARAAPGDLAFAELMIDPARTSDVRGEWIELVSRADGPRSLVECELWVDGDGAPLEALEADGVAELRVPAGGRFIVASEPDPNTNGGVTVDARWRGLLLPNRGATVAVRCDGEPVVSFTYGDAFVLVPGRALSLDAEAPLDPATAAAPERWCDARAELSGGDLGTPGAPNRACPPRRLEIDDCRVLAPLDASVVEGEPVELLAALHIAGWTDVSDGRDPVWRLRAEAGWGPAGDDPREAATWTWRAALGDEAWRDEDGDGRDRYVVTLAAPPIGSRGVAFRFSRDDGSTWRYCDALGGAFEPGSLGGFTVVDDPCAPNPCAAPPAPSCDEDVAVTPVAPGTCAVVAGDGGAPSADCAYGSERRACRLDGGRCEGGACVDVAPSPGPGEIVITEIMTDPVAVFDSVGEWIELTSVAAGPRSLNGCRLGDDAFDDHAIAADAGLIAGPGEILVLARDDDPSSNGGVEDVAYRITGGFSLGNFGDDLALTCEGVVVDEVAWDTITWPPGEGRAMSLNPRHLDALANDDGARWCDGYTPIHDGVGADFGTPGVANPPCPEVPARCRLSPPARYDVLDGEAFEVAGRLYHPGVTDVSAGVDADPWAAVEAGFGPVGSAPGGQGWRWFDAGGDVGWSDDDAPGEDRYVAAVTAPDDAGEYDLALRVTIDDGLTWHACDRDTGALGEDGSENGYQPANAAELVVSLETVCHPNPCDAPPADACDGDVALVHGAFGACTIAGAADDLAVCDYAPVAHDCAARGGRCEAGACVDVAPPPLEGEVVITEIMARPRAVADFFGEWVELSSGAEHSIDLHGCVLSDAGGVEAPIEVGAGGLVLDPGGVAVIARDGDAARNGGVVADAAYGPLLALADAADTVTLTCEGGVVDRVAYAAPPDGAFPGVAGASMSLTAGADAASNDEGAEWCAAVASYGYGDLGTPGASNPACAD